MTPSALAVIETLRAHHQRQADEYADDPHRHGFHTGWVAAIGDVLLIDKGTEAVAT
jgi:hypothetical protein